MIFLFCTVVAFDAALLLFCFRAKGSLLSSFGHQTQRAFSCFDGAKVYRNCGFLEKRKRTKKVSILISDTYFHLFFDICKLRENQNYLMACQKSPLLPKITSYSFLRLPPLTSISWVRNSFCLYVGGTIP